MSEVVALGEELIKMRNHSRRQNHHINSQKNFIDEVVQQNLAYRTNISMLNEALKQLESEKVALKGLVARVEELEKQLEEEKKKTQSVSEGAVPPAVNPEQDAA